MENLSPTLLLILEVRGALENGFSVRTGILQFIKISQSPFATLLSQWLITIDQGQDLAKLYAPLHPCRRALLTLLDRGMKGSAILSHLIDLEKEVLNSCEAEIEEHLQKLPLKLLLPILFFMFPAYLLLLLGPVLESILGSL